MYYVLNLFVYYIYLFLFLFIPFPIVINGCHKCCVLLKIISKFTYIALSGIVPWSENVIVRKRQHVPAPYSTLTTNSPVNETR